MKIWTKKHLFKKTINEKATFKNFTDFVDATYKEGGVSTGIIRNTIERGLREWGEGSQANS